MKQPRIHIRWYILGDIIASAISWVAFYFLRKYILGQPFFIFKDFYFGIISMPVAWTMLYFLTGTYSSLYAKSRLFEFFHTMVVSFVGSVLILFFVLIDDSIGDYTIYYKEFLSLFFLQLFFISIFRILMLSKAKKQVEDGSVYFNSIIVGANGNALSIYNSIINNTEKTGYNIVGYVNTKQGNKTALVKELPYLGNTIDLSKIIEEQTIEEVIVAIEKSEREELEEILQQLSDKDVNIKITPDRVDIISGAVHTSNVLGVPLIDLHIGLMPGWQQNIKRLLDILLSVLGLILLSPLIAYTAIRVKLSSAGSIFYFQERIGYKGKPFIMYKFRSMAWMRKRMASFK
ncbi:MAG: sugar transferase [Chitinophagaceae bacterium]|nr:sugar transferase [Chitinophagaceae bacterium]